MYAGGNDPGCREPLWNPGISYNASAAPLGSLLATLNAYRRRAGMSAVAQVERWQDDSLYAFSKGENLILFTNVGTAGAPQTRTVTYLPSSWADGDTVCNLLECSECATVANGSLSVTLKGAEGVAVYDKTVRC